MLLTPLSQRPEGRDTGQLDDDDEDDDDDDDDDDNDNDNDDDDDEKTEGLTQSLGS